MRYLSDSILVFIFSSIPNNKTYFAPFPMVDCIRNHELKSSPSKKLKDPHQLISDFIKVILN